MLAAMTRRQIGGLVFFVLVGLGFVAGGLYQIRQQRSGAEARATVRSCDRGRRSLVCRGSWTEGSLLSGGRVVLGIIEGATDDDIGKTVDVRVHGDRAYVPGLRLPIIFFALGAAFLVGGVASQLRASRRRLSP
jgi:hypothetical protein